MVTNKAIDIGKPEQQAMRVLRTEYVRRAFRRNYGSLSVDGPLSETSRWRAIVRVLRSPLDALGSALLPASCTLCGSPLPRLSSVPNCPACWTELPVQGGIVCHRCGDTLEAPITEGIASS